MTDEEPIINEYFLQDIFDRDVLIHHLKGLLETAVDCEVTNGKSGLSAEWLAEAKKAVDWDDE